MSEMKKFEFTKVIQDISDLAWDGMGEADMTRVAWAYYFFSIQFRENLLLACEYFCDDQKLQKLKLEECDTSNLSPYPDIAEIGERMDHDEFMRRALLRLPLPEDVAGELRALGDQYLREVEEVDTLTRALSIGSYESGGLEAVFTAMLRAPGIEAPRLAAFKHFLAEHIRFDSDVEAGHGVLSQGMQPDDRILPLWQSFKKILVASAPALQAAVRTGVLSDA